MLLGAVRSNRSAHEMTLPVGRSANNDAQVYVTVSISSAAEIEMRAILLLRLTEISAPSSLGGISARITPSPAVAVTIWRQLARICYRHRLQPAHCGSSTPRLYRREADVQGGIKNPDSDWAALIIQHDHLGFHHFKSPTYPGLNGAQGRIQSAALSV